MIRYCKSILSSEEISEFDAGILTIFLDLFDFTPIVSVSIFFFHNIYDSPLYFIRIIVTRAVWKCQRGYLTVYKIFYRKNELTRFLECSIINLYVKKETCKVRELMIKSMTGFGHAEKRSKEQNFVPFHGTLALRL